MAKVSSSNNKRTFGIFLFLAVALVFTLYSFRNVPTNTQQNASSTTCASIGGGCVSSGRDCASGYTNSNYSCSSGVCCLPSTLPTPTGLIAYSSYCKTGIPLVEYDTINFNWNRDSIATGYILYHRVYTTTNAYAYTAVNLSGNSNTSYLYNTKSLNGRKVQWYIVAVNSYTKSNNSVILNTPTAYRSCAN